MRTHPRVFIFVLLTLASLAAADRVNGQPVSQVAAADTSSPRATLFSFLDATNEVARAIREQHYVDRADERFQPAVERINDCMNTEGLPAFAAEEYAAEVAIYIKEILDRVEIPAEEEIPDLDMIDEAGGFEKLSRWRIPGTRLTIARVEDGPQKHEYLFSPGTLERAPSYFQSLQRLPYRTDGPETSPGLYDWYVSAPGGPGVARVVSRLPDSLRLGRTLGMANWKWPGMFICLVIAMATMLCLYSIHLRLASRWHEKRIVLYCLTAIFPMAAAAVPLVFSHVCFEHLTIRGNPLYAIRFISIAVGILACIVVVFVLCNRIAEAVISSPRINRRGLNAQLIRIAAKLSSVVLTVVVFLVGGQYLGIPVATLLASAGVGGVALALGAQDTLKTLFGTVMLMADKPFRVGDRIVFRGYDGVVEDIGLRSTRIRLLSSHLVTVPNDELCRSDIENVGRRTCIRRMFDIHIPLDTPCEKVEAAVEIVRRELNDHEGCNSESHPPRVYFLDFIPGAFTIRVFYWYHPAEYWKYLAFGERFNFAVFRAFEARGIPFSLPQRLTAASAEGKPAPLELKNV